MKYKPRWHCKTFAILLTLAMLFSIPIATEQAYGTEGSQLTGSVDLGDTSSGTITESNSDVSSGAPKDASLEASQGIDSDTPIQQRSTGEPVLLEATAKAYATAGYAYISIDLFGTTFTNEATNKEKWSLGGSSGLSINSISKTDSNALLQLSDNVEKGDTITVSAEAAALTDGSTLSDVSVTIHIPIAAVGTATATAGGKAIAVNLTQGGFADSSDKGNWTLDGTSAGGNSIATVAYQDVSNVTITLTNPIGTSDNYTLQANQSAFVNIMTKPFATPLDVTISGGATTPTFTEGYPQAGAMQSAGSRQVGVTISAQEAAYYDFVLLPDGATAPSPEQVRDGQDAYG
ncbi:hypothetical protein [Syntrophomonas zehnderi]|nr:hypothetical protein [Syntrophomonas zehnderi]